MEATRSKGWSGFIQRRAHPPHELFAFTSNLEGDCLTYIHKHQAYRGPSRIKFRRIRDYPRPIGGDRCVGLRFHCREGFFGDVLLRIGNGSLAIHYIGLLTHGGRLVGFRLIDRVIDAARLHQDTQRKKRDCDVENCRDPIPLPFLFVTGIPGFTISFYFVNKSADLVAELSDIKILVTAENRLAVRILAGVRLRAFWIVAVRHASAGLLFLRFTLAPKTTFADLRRAFSALSRG